MACTCVAMHAIVMSMTEDPALNVALAMEGPSDVPQHIAGHSSIPQDQTTGASPTYLGPGALASCAEGFCCCCSCCLCCVVSQNVSGMLPAGAPRERPHLAAGGPLSPAPQKHPLKLFQAQARPGGQAGVHAHLPQLVSLSSLWQPPLQPAAAATCSPAQNTSLSQHSLAEVSVERCNYELNNNAYSITTVLHGQGLIGG